MRLFVPLGVPSWIMINTLPALGRAIMFPSRVELICVVPAMKDQEMKNMLDEITRRIREVSDPEQIILFGSRARGDSRPDSDVDLLIIKDNIESTRAEAGRIYRA
jgi:hypothetical protein